MIVYTSTDDAASRFWPKSRSNQDPQEPHQGHEHRQIADGKA